VHLQVLDLIEALIKSRGWSYLRLDGSVISRDRQGLIDAYNKDDDYSKLIFLVSTKAGGVGINLVSACKVIMVSQLLFILYYHTLLYSAILV
jgi:DNA repair and recombination protein RAD54B